LCGSRGTTVSQKRLFQHVKEPLLRAETCRFMMRKSLFGIVKQTHLEDKTCSFERRSRLCYKEKDYLCTCIPKHKSMKQRVLLILLAVMLCVGTRAADVQRKRIDLAGQWLFASEKNSAPPMSGLPDFTKEGAVRLPGTTDTNQKGTPLTATDETTHLSRRYSYVGKAWYQREVEIPKDWKNKRITLHMERTKSTTVWVDGKKAGSNNDITTPQRYVLTPYLKPGRHTVTIEVDNKQGVPPQLLTSSHAFTEDTQTNWNGIIGQIFLEATAKVSVQNVLPMISDDGKTLRVRVSLSGQPSRASKLTVSLEPSVTCSYSLEPVTKNIEKRHEGDIDVELDVSRARFRWSEFRPELCTLKVTLEGQDELTQTVGLRTFHNHLSGDSAPDNHFYINGQRTFLRGKHDACVFPLTAHVAMDTDSWRKYFSVLKQYGINHVRFHSWCPPEACFAVADEMGFYLQPELPYWGDFNASDSTLMSFLHKEGMNLIREYGHHASFVMFALGNELWGSIDKMRSFVRDFRAVDPSKLYTLGSNYYLGFKETAPEMDYFTTCRIGREAWGETNTHTRGSFSFADASDGGLINHSHPNTVANFESAIRNTRMPVISHETGQFQTYPDYDEIAKYTGVLRPCNMETFRKRLRQAGMEAQAKDFRKASGLWSVELYKADVELDLRTSNMAGFQLLDLQDYPGQGSAYIGILDAFMDSKNLVAPERWRQWCSPVVPLAELPSYCFTVGDTVSIGVKVADYSDRSQPVSVVSWQLLNGRGEVVEEGKMKNQSARRDGLLSFGNITLTAKLKDKSVSERQRLVLAVDGTEYKNDWNIWVYADCKRAVENAKAASDIIITDTMTQQTVANLVRGTRVLLMPKASSYRQQTVGGLLQTDYWNYRMFKTISQNNKKPVSPGTLGLLIDTSSAALKGFPTEMHSNWQWGEIAHNARPMALDMLPAEYKPIVQVIDNIERNHKLGLLFEFTVGKGKLLVCMSDLSSMTQYPEACQLYKSILDYMRSTSFSPKETLTPGQLNALLTAKAADSNVKELRNISYD